MWLLYLCIRLRETELALQTLRESSAGQLEQQKLKMSAEMAEVSNHVVPQIERIKRDMHNMQKASEKEKRKVSVLMEVSVVCMYVCTVTVYKCIDVY